MFSQIIIPKDKNISPAFNAFGNVWKQIKNNTFKIKITKFDRFTNNQQHFDQWINQMYMYIEIKKIPND